MSARIEAVICDFGGVLTTPLLGGFAQALDGVPVEALGMAMHRATQERGENPLYELERGHLAEAEFFAIVGGALEREVGRAVPMREFAERYFNHLQTNDELLDHLRAVQAEGGVRLAMLTNNVREWEARWRAMIPGIDELFDPIVDSAFVGMRKPEPGIYELTLERLGLPGEACVFIDDLDVNCAAARAFGITAIQFADTTQAIRDLDAALGRS